MDEVELFNFAVGASTSAVMAGMSKRYIPVAVQASRQIVSDVIYGRKFARANVFNIGEVSALAEGSVKLRVRPTGWHKYGTRTGTGRALRTVKSELEASFVPAFRREPSVTRLLDAFDLKLMEPAARGCVNTRPFFEEWLAKEEQSQEFLERFHQLSEHQNQGRLGVTARVLKALHSPLCVGEPMSTTDKSTLLANVPASVDWLSRMFDISTKGRTLPKSAFQFRTTRYSVGVQRIRHSQIEAHFTESDLSSILSDLRDDNMHDAVLIALATPAEVGRLKKVVRGFSAPGIRLLGDPCTGIRSVPRQNVKSGRLESRRFFTVMYQLTPHAAG